MVQKQYPEFENLVQLAVDDSRIMALYLIGSYGTPYYGPLSDLDFAILTKEMLSVEEQLSLLATFSAVLISDNVDLIFLNRAPLELQHKVLAEGRLLYNWDRIFVANFAERIIKLYCDFAIDLKQFYRDYDEALRKEFLHD